ncbi:MAG: GTP-dependent dephospho-CoA kinase family protein [Sulfolobales archaeon]|nr:GTP-dependent dephospho-CoA kinase family protein [Sulfolobales archaeon]MDW8083571.1 GTP-dependent dephospho-CoA kinase family protein [Sulfolobales archaeon]
MRTNYSGLRLKCLKLPEELRDSLSRGFLGVKICGSVEYVTNRLLSLLIDCRALVAVGDFICSKLLDYGYTPRVCVVDGVTRRALHQPVLAERFNTVTGCVNPRSHVCQNAVEEIRRALQSREEVGRVLIIVDGEEDLLALPAIAESPPDWCITYGLPNCGVELVIVDEEVSETARRILELFEEVEIQL